MCLKQCLAEISLEGATFILKSLFKNVHSIYSPLFVILSYYI